MQRLLNYRRPDEKMKTTTAMLLAEAGCVFIGFILYSSGVQGRAKSVCALRGSSVDLPCSAEYPTSNMKWFTIHWNGSQYVQNEIPADGNHITYNTLAERNFTLTIKDWRESDAKFYCCRETNIPGRCWLRNIELHVADLQVKVIPSTEGQTVTLMCSTSCALTEKPAAYIWYKNGEFLYEDWSPWYQQLVSSETSVTYSCAIKGYEHLRAPEVSVDSITPACFTVSKGRMCSNKETSKEESCSITYPREVRVERTSSSKDDLTLTCNTSCPLTRPQTAYKWYRSKHVYRFSEGRELFLSSPTDESVACAIKGLEDLRSAETCIGDKSCWRVNYVSRRICALQGSSVNISSEYWYPDNQRPKSKFWYKIKRLGQEGAEQLTEDAGHVEYHSISENHHILRIKDLSEKDSAGYTFRLITDDGGWKQSDSSAVTLTVTGLKVTLAPSAVVTEGQRVTLSCSTSCPLPDNTNYIWYFNRRHLTPSQSQNKHLVLEPVSSQHAGNYSCAVETDTEYVISLEETVTVQALQTSMAIINGVRLTVALSIPVLFYLLMMRKKKTLTSFPECSTLKTGQMDSENNNISLPVADPQTAARGEPEEPLSGTVLSLF